MRGMDASPASPDYYARKEPGGYRRNDGSRGEGEKSHLWWKKLFGNISQDLFRNTLKLFNGGEGRK